jgi:ABC-type Na+ efflux pump permease subunit
MKFESKILVIAILFLALMGGNSTAIFAAEDTNSTSTGVSITSTNVAPSESFLQRTKKNSAIEMQGLTTYSGSGIMSPFSGDWQAFNDDDSEGGNLPPGNIGGSPIGDVTLPMILSFLLLYFVYRGVTVSKRKNL